ncbi:centrosomal protein of 83 kDa [Thalassophryne amazonica]|uniref:centrosomal protein of 83 kDa n=1 Tax=Thalassophryne amazonica TaxID=390379 RepID=UPI0014716A8B|nr:centrosomal protein of 83 kDa [Thalassophryne amazonica]
MNPSNIDHSAAPVPNLESGMRMPAALLKIPAGLSGAQKELYELLIDERMKSENHKTNYKTLKAQHTCLEDEYIRLQGELKSLHNERQVQQEKLELLLAKLRADLLDKGRELEELRRQAMTPHQLALLRAEVQQEMEAPVRERFSKLEELAEKYRSKYNKLQYDYTILKSQYDCQKDEISRTLEHMRIRYATEISCLQKDKEDLVARYQSSDAQQDKNRVEALLREKAQLHRRVKGLEDELAEIIAQKEKSDQEAENVQRIQKRQLSEFEVERKSVEAEHESLRHQLEQLKNELDLSYEQNSQLTERLHKAETDVNARNGTIESLKHSHKHEVTTIKQEFIRTKAALERERDALQGQIDGLQADLEMLQAAVDQHKEVLVEKERELVRKVQSAHEDEFSKIATLHEEKLELEKRVAELVQHHALQNAADLAQKEEWEERLCVAQQNEEFAQREVQNMRKKLQQQSSHLEEVETQKEDIADLKHRNQELCNQLKTLSLSERELMDSQKRLTETVDRIRDELRMARAQAEKSQHEAERQVENRQIEWLEEKHKLQTRLDELQHKYSQAKDKMQRAALVQKKRKILTENKEKRLKDKIQLLEAKTEELELQVVAAKKYASNSEEVVQLRRQLKELQRRHNEFRNLLLGSHRSANMGPTFLTSQTDLLVRSSEDLLSNIPEEQHQREMALLYQRLDHLENAQRQQLEELNSLAQRNRNPSPQPDL